MCCWDFPTATSQYNNSEMNFRLPGVAENLDNRLKWKTDSSIIVKWIKCFISVNNKRPHSISELINQTMPDSVRSCPSQFQSPRGFWLSDGLMDMSISIPS